jgi:hypothetical protein
MKNKVLAVFDQNTVNVCLGWGGDVTATGVEKEPCYMW